MFIIALLRVIVLGFFALLLTVCECVTACCPSTVVFTLYVSKCVCVCVWRRGREVRVCLGIFVKDWFQVNFAEKIQFKTNLSSSPVVPSGFVGHLEFWNFFFKAWDSESAVYRVQFVRLLLVVGHHF